MKYLVLYITIAILYGFYSMIRHFQKHPLHTSWFRMFTVFLLNFIFMPFTLIIAIRLRILFPSRTEHLRFIVVMRKLYRTMFITRYQESPYLVRKFRDLYAIAIPFMWLKYKIRSFFRSEKDEWLDGQIISIFKGVIDIKKKHTYTQAEVDVKMKHLMDKYKIDKDNNEEEG